MFYGNGLKNKRAPVNAQIFLSITLQPHYDTPVWKQRHMQTGKKSFNYASD